MRFDSPMVPSASSSIPFRKELVQEIRRLIAQEVYGGIDQFDIALDRMIDITR